MQVYFAEVKNINDPTMAGRVQVKVLNLENYYTGLEYVNSEWFHCILMTDNSMPYRVGDRVAVTFLNESAHNGGLVLGRVNVLGFLDGSKRHTNVVEQGAYQASLFGINRESKSVKPIEPPILFELYPNTSTNVYNENLLIASDSQKSLIQDKKGSYLFFDTLSNLFLKSIANMFIFCITKMLLYSTVNIELRVGLSSKIEISNEKIEISIRGSKITLSDLGVQINGASIWLN